MADDDDFDVLDDGKGEAGTVPKFIVKLMAILDDPAAKAFIAWSPVRCFLENSGMCFCFVFLFPTFRLFHTHRQATRLSWTTRQTWAALSFRGASWAQLGGRFINFC